MSAYDEQDELKIRTGRLVRDWANSRLISESQRDQMLPELEVSLRRTNKFLRVTLFIFGLLILQSVAGVLALSISFGSEAVAGILCAAVAAASLWLAHFLIREYRFYRFGIEEAAAIAGVALAGVAAGLIVGEGTNFVRELPFIAGLLAAAAVSLMLFLRFGFVYGAVIAMVLSVTAVFIPGDSDMAHRLVAAAVLTVCFALARSARERHGLDFPADNYAIIEAAAWIGLYLVINLQISNWLSSPDGRTPFYWMTYVFTWLMPAAGLWIAVHDRHRMLLDVNIVMAIVTLMTNKAYLGAPRNPYDPIAFGVLLVVVAIGVRRWLASGEDGSRGGYVAERLVESEKERLGLVGTISVLHQGSVAEPAKAPPPPALGGGGRSGGAGASGSF
jgi:hypothetical protein